MGRAQALLAAGDGGARDGTAFVQLNKLRINTKYLILDATHHVTVRCGDCANYLVHWITSESILA
jgi:hypothetical protein